MKKFLSLLMIIFVLFAAINVYAQSASQINDIDSLTTTDITPYMKQYHMTTYAQYENGYEGGDGWQHVMCMQVSPFNSNFVVMGTDTSGLWTTRDGGKSWQNTSSGFMHLSVLDVDFDPQNDNIIYAMGAPGHSLNTEFNSGVYISEDAGYTWSAVLNDIKFIMRNERENLILFDKIEGKDYSQVYVAAYEKGILYSDDKGKTWSVFGFENEIIKEMYKEGETFAVLTDSGLYISKNNGKDFSLAVYPSSNDDVLGISVNPSDNSNILYYTETELYSSNDYGVNWQIINTTTSPYVYQELVFGAPLENQNCILYVSVSKKTILLSLDGGVTFASALNDLTNAFNQSESNKHLVVAPSPSNKDVVYVSSPWEIFKSNDAGKNFSASSSGFCGMRARDFAFNPDNYNEMYISFIDAGIVKTIYQNKGEQYPLVFYGGDDSTGIRNEKRKTCHAIAIDPKNTNRVLVSVSGCIKETTNGGQSYTKFETPEGDCVYIGFHKQNPNIIFAGNYISIDDGLSWKKVDYNIRAMSEIDSDIIYGVLDSKLYKSDDCGTTWTALNQGVAGNVNVLADNVDKNKVYVGSFSNGLFMYDGTRWVQKKTGAPGWIIAQDPKNANHLISGGTDTSKPAKGIYETYDGGNSWTLIEGLTGSCDVWGMDFHPDLPRVYIGTSSGTFVYEYEKFKNEKVMSDVDNNKNISIWNTSMQKLSPEIILSAHQGDDLKIDDAKVFKKVLMPYQKILLDVSDVAQNKFNVFVWNNMNPVSSKSKLEFE